MGKFGRDNFEEGNKWRVYCKDMLEHIECNYKVKTINPNDYFNFKDESPRYKSEKEIMRFDLRKVRNSNLVMVNFNDVYSLGSMAEIAVAFENRIPIIGLNLTSNVLHPWQEEMSDRIFYDIDEMLEYVKEVHLI